MRSLGQVYWANSCLVKPIWHYLVFVFIVDFVLVDGDSPNCCKHVMLGQRSAICTNSFQDTFDVVWFKLS